MKPQELRIGNWVSVQGKPVRVESIYDDEINVSMKWGKFSHDYVLEGYGDFDPIPLTPEILEAAGFKNDVCIVAPNDAFILQETAAVGFIPVSYDDWQPIGMRIEYLHQLQNLFFALTGTELEINMMQKA